MNPAQYKVVVIGAGKIAWSIAPAFKKASFKIVSVISRKKQSAKELAVKLRVSVYSNKLVDISASANLFVLAVPDNQIKSVSIELANLKLNFKKSIFIHLSGLETAASLASLKEKGGYTGSIHIMQTFPSRAETDIQGCYAAIESNNKKVQKLLFALAEKLKLKTFPVLSESKALYHLSGVYAVNFLVGNLFLAETIFSSLKTGKDFSEITGASIKTAVDNVLTKKALHSLSGPIERGDQETIKKHLNALDELIKNNRENEQYQHLRESYIIQSLNLIELIKRRDIKPKPEHQSIKKLLLERSATNR